MNLLLNRRVPAGARLTMTVPAAGAAAGGAPGGAPNGAPNGGGAPVQAASSAPEPGSPADEWSQLWFATLQQPWTKLVLVPAAPGAPVLAAAQALVDAARIFESRRVELVDATGAAPNAVPQLVADIAEREASGARVIVAVDSPLANRGAIPLANAADAALLVVQLGGTSFATARETVELFGRRRFVGSVALKASR